MRHPASNTGRALRSDCSPNRAQSASGWPKKANCSGQCDEDRDQIQEGRALRRQVDAGSRFPSLEALRSSDPW